MATLKLFTTQTEEFLEKQSVNFNPIKKKENLEKGSPFLFILNHYSPGN